MRVLLISSAFVALVALSVPAAAEPVSLLPTGSETAMPLSPSRLAPLAPDSVWTPRFEAAVPLSPSRLAPLAPDSVWTPRFEAAADELAAALRSRDAALWAPLFGGRWMSGADRARVDHLLRDPDSPFQAALLSKAASHRAIFGWSAPPSLSADERTAIEVGDQAEALICWSAGAGGEGSWPTTAREADNRPGSAFACARIVYSVRGDAATWRAFIEPGAV
ncbi:MAG: hypothetical protein KYX64_04760 [Sphingopyxis sp.]|nr:hypothetical protein [Sphingopyxis sp.]